MLDAAPSERRPTGRAAASGDTENFGGRGASDFRSLLKRATSIVRDFVADRKRNVILSERVRRCIERQEAASEIVVSWIQASAIAFFALVYTVSPKAFPANAPFQPVPWTLAIYALFSIARIVLAHRRRLTPGFLVLSIFIDIAVLMITIWSFSLQYHAPPALYLKAPTLMYVFILIALRTLRFDPRYVLLAGGASALRCFVLFAVAAWGSGANAPGFTHNYVEYVTSYKILLGTEIDKILSIGLVTIILALSLVRARKLLVNSTSEELTARDLSRFFAPEVTEEIRRLESDPILGRGQRRSAAILLIDMRGSTQLSKSMPAEQFIALLRECQSHLVPVIDRHGGSIDKYLGDGILASFGAVAASPTCAADLCRAIEDLVVTAGAWRLERESRARPAPALGIAGAVGEVVFGAVGHETRLEYTVIGEVVNLVAKLEKHTKREGVQALTTRASFLLAMEQGFQPQGSTDERPQRSVEGIEEPVDLVGFRA